jgi:hypothetical protein
MMLPPGSAHCAAGRGVLLFDHQKTTKRQEPLMPSSHFIRPLACTFFAAALCSQSAFALDDEDMRFRTTEDLYQVCAVAPDAAEYIPASYACRGFIEAAVQYHDAVSNRRNLERLICYPESATVGDGRAAFVAWGKRNARNKKLMAELPVVGLVRALADKYPCGN